MKIALASPRIPTSVADGLEKVRALMADAAADGAEIACFPEAYIPGLRGLDFSVPDFDPPQLESVLRTVGGWAKEFGLATILGSERFAAVGRQIAAYVFDRTGELLGVQTKNQIDPSEDAYYVPGDTRRVFTVGALTFGIAICHEGWRYPETVRWAAIRGAAVVFHPQHTGSDRAGPVLAAFGVADAPYYEKAMTMRSRENTIYFASVNYAMRFQESATAVISPTGECEAFLPYGTEGALIHELDLPAATGLLARRYAPNRYRDG